MRYLSFPLVLLLCGSLAAGATVVISVPDRVEVNSNSVRLADIAQIPAGWSALGELSFGYAPYPGHHRWITKEEIEQKLTHGSPHPVRLEMSERILVTRRSVAVSDSDIRDAVTAYLRSSHPDLEWTFHEIRLPRQIEIPPGEITIEADRNQQITRLDGFNLRIDLFVDGRGAGSHWVWIDAVARGSVVTAQRTLPYKHRVQNEDIALESRPLTRLESYFRRTDQIEGMVTKRSIPAGSLITERDLDKPLLVKRGEVVQIVVAGAGFRVSTLGRARGSAALGEAVDVENLQTRKIVQGKASAENTVEIKTPKGL